MRNQLNPKLEQWRRPHFFPVKQEGYDGFFLIPGPEKNRLKVLSTTGDGWEHLSISVHKSNRLPTWTEMCYIKDIFFDDDEVVMQLHPAKKDWVNNHNSVLHLWRPLNNPIPLPPPIMVGVAGVSPEDSERIAHRLAARFQRERR